jgi:hypothetical protein
MPSDVGAQPPPAILIRIEFEASSPRVLCDYMNDGAERRMLDWLSGRPDLLGLIQNALELEEAA